MGTTLGSVLGVFVSVLHGTQGDQMELGIKLRSPVCKVSRPSEPSSDVQLSFKGSTNGFSTLGSVPGTDHARSTISE